MFELAISHKADNEDKAIENQTVVSVWIRVEHYDVEQRVEDILQKLDHFFSLNIHKGGEDRWQLIWFWLRFQ